MSFLCFRVPFNKKNGILTWRKTFIHSFNLLSSCSLLARRGYCDWSFPSQRKHTSLLMLNRLNLPAITFVLIEILLFALPSFLLLNSSLWLLYIVVLFFQTVFSLHFLPSSLLGLSEILGLSMFLNQEPFLAIITSNTRHYFLWPHTFKPPLFLSAKYSQLLWWSLHVV